MSQCEVCPSSSPSTTQTTVITAIITAIVTALLEAVVFVVVQIAVCKLHPKFRSGGVGVSEVENGQSYYCTIMIIFTHELKVQEWANKQPLNITETLGHFHTEVLDLMDHT